jgi:hypothetical protein
MTDAPDQPSGEIAEASTDTKPADDAIDQIRRIGELLDAGHITRDEFDAKKAELLARL